MRYSFALLALLSLTHGTIAQGQNPPTYWQDIRPILRKYCTVCHSAKNLKEVEVSGGLALDSYEAVMKSPKKAVIVAGKSQESSLVQLLLTTDEDRRMPKGSSQPLPKEAIAQIARWIDAGAPEGNRPEETLTTTGTRPQRVRQLEVVLRTNAIPPAELVKGKKPAPLDLLIPVGPLAPVTALRYHPGKPWLAVGQYGQVTIWDLSQASPIRVLTNVLGAVHDLRFSPDGSLLAVAGGQPSFKGDVRLYRTDSWELVGVLRGHDDSVFSVAFSPDGKRLASASFDKTVRIWNLQTRQSDVIITGHSDFVYAVVFSPDGKWLASASKDRSVKFFDAATGQSLVTLSGMNQDVTALAVHPGGRELVSAGFEPALIWWRIDLAGKAAQSVSTESSAGQRLRTQAGHGATVYELAFSSDGKLLASASTDGSVRLWNGESGAALQTISVGSVQYAVAWRADSQQLAAGGFDGIVRLYDTKTARLLALLVCLPEANGEPRWLTLTPEGYVATVPALLPQLKWRLQNQEVESAPVPSALLQPERIRQAIGGQSLPAPFQK